MRISTIKVSIQAYEGEIVMAPEEEFMEREVIEGLKLAAGALIGVLVIGVILGTAIGS